MFQKTDTEFVTMTSSPETAKWFVEYKHEDRSFWCFNTREEVTEFLMNELPGIWSGNFIVHDGHIYMWTPEEMISIFEEDSEEYNTVNTLEKLHEYFSTTSSFKLFVDDTDGEVPINITDVLYFVKSPGEEDWHAHSSLKNCFNEFNDYELHIHREAVAQI